MANESKELREVKNDIRRGIRYRREYGHDPDWPMWREWYQGKFPGDKQMLPVNLVYMLLRSMIPRIYFRSPRIRITSRRPERHAHARVLEVVDNWLIQELGIKRQFKRILLDTALFGTGIVKTGFDSEFGFLPELAGYEAMNPATGEMLDVPDESLTGIDRGGDRIEYNADVQAGMPWALRVHPMDFIIDPAADDMRNARWVAHRILRTVDDVKADEKFSHTRDINATHRLEDRNKHSDRLFLRPDMSGPDGQNQEKTDVPSPEWVELWEVRDVKGGRIKVLSMGHGQFIRDDRDVLQLDGLPYEALVFNDDPEAFWGMSDVQIFMPQQLEMNELRTQFRDMRRASIPRIVGEEDAFDEEAIAALLSEHISPYVKSRGNPNETLKFWQPQLPLDQMMWGDRIMGDVREMIGMSRNQAGEYDQSSRRTATEAKIVQQGSEIRVNERRDLMSDFLVNTMRKINQVIFRFWTAPKVAQVIGPDSAQHWVQYTGEQLRGEYDYEVNPDEALPVSSNSRRQELMLLLQTLTPLAQAGIVPPQGIQELVKELLGIFEVTSAERVMGGGAQPAGQPGQQGAMSLQQFGQVRPGPQQQPTPMGASANSNVSLQMPQM